MRLRLVVQVSPMAFTSHYQIPNWVRMKEFGLGHLSGDPCFLLFRASFILFYFIYFLLGLRWNTVCRREDS